MTSPKTPDQCPIPENRFIDRFNNRSGGYVTTPDGLVPLPPAQPDMAEPWTEEEMKTYREWFAARYPNL